MQLAVRGVEDEDEEPTALSPGGVSEAVQFRASDVGGMAMALLNMLLEMYGELSKRLIHAYKFACGEENFCLSMPLELHAAVARDLYCACW